MRSRRFAKRTTAVLVCAAALGVLLAGCFSSRPLPTEADVPDAMLFHYPGAEIISKGSLPASDDDYIDTGGSHEPLEVIARYRLPEPVPRDDIFDWMLDQADKIGLEDCKRETVRGDEGISVERIACDTEAVTGYRGKVRLSFPGEDATSADGRASTYRTSVALHAW